MAPFTRVQTYFCTDEFCSWTACLHGSVQILLQWCLHGSVQSLDQSRYLIPGHNRAIWAKSCTVWVFTRVRTNMEPCRSKSRPKLAHLTVQKFVQCRRSPCKRKTDGTVQVFVSAKICPDPCKRGLNLPVRLLVYLTIYVPACLSLRVFMLQFFCNIPCNSPAWQVVVLYTKNKSNWQQDHSTWCWWYNRGGRIVRCGIK